MKQILLNSSKNNNVVVEGSEYIELSTKQHSLPVDYISGIVNHYEVYLNERNNCKDYKMFFTLHPYMTNVLFNTFTEIVYNEGGKNSGIIGTKGKMKEGHESYFPSSGNVGNQKTYKALKGEGEYGGDRRYQLIRDTEFSHEKLGGITYYCGLDIFNNHYLRSDGFFNIKKVDGNNNVFNTIEDFLIYNNGNLAQHNREYVDGGDIEKYKTRNTHLFNHENIRSITTAFSEGIKENNGWVGFYNRAYLPSVTFKVKNEDVVINKCINNRNACDFIDMYPDRTLFSFLPKINYNYNEREEYNWKWFLTYPYKNVYKDENGEDFDFFDKDKGLKIIWNDSKEKQVTRDGRIVYFRTKCKHNLTQSDVIKMTCNNSEFSLPILGVGDEFGKQKDYYFSVSYDDLVDEFGEKRLKNVFYIEIPSDIYISKVISGVPCKYYVRQFKKLRNLTSTLNKMAFSRTIYNDNITQIMYGENISVDGIIDNLGREVSEIYLTLLKNNKGYENYYISGNTMPHLTEFSHCFGKITSGFNFETDGDEIKRTSPSSETFTSYNVRCLYNLLNFDDDNISEFINKMGIPYEPPKAAENNITEFSDYFLGDFVEFSPSTVTETVIEDVYHRFNTAQREMKLKNDIFDFSKFKYDEITYDDFDFDTDSSNGIPDFKVEINEGFRNMADNGIELANNTDTCDNIMTEGYFYKPHYRVKLKEYSDVLSFAYDTIIAYGGENLIEDYGVENYYQFQTPINHNFTNEDKILIYYKDNSYKEYYVHPLTQKNSVVFGVPNGTDKIKGNDIKYIFKKNREIPSYAYYLGDGSGKYVWRKLIPDTELSQDSDIYNRTYANGAVYINTNVNFYLRRQDPYGIYGTKYTSKKNGNVSDFTINGVSVELPDIDYKIEETYSVCEN